MIPINIKAKLAIIGKTGKELNAELSKRGVKLYPSDFSKMINGKMLTRKGDMAREVAIQILDGWERRV